MPPTEQATTTYSDSRFGYSIDLPSGWRPATDFMSAFASTLGRPQAGGNAEDYTVVTAISPDAESQFVADAPSKLDLLTGLGPWLEFFFLDTVQIFPATRDRDAQLKSADQGSARHIVSNAEDLTLDNGQAATRFTVELFSDYGLFIYDRVFVEGAVTDCPICTGFIIQTAKAGRSLDPPGAVDPPLAAYPVEDFEAIFRSFQLSATPSPTPGQLPDTGGSPLHPQAAFPCP